jgi:cytochrome P450
MSDRQVRDEAIANVTTGNAVTVSGLLWTFYLLAQHPDAEARLHAELANVLGGRQPTLDDVPRLVFTRAVFEEAMRLYPPVPFLGRQALRDETIRNRPIPEGSLLVVVPWLLHRHKKLWDWPDRFMPERFLPENAGSRQRYSYIPFSVGPRVCTGAAFGLTEALLCIATLAQRARLRLAPGTVVEPICRLTLRPGQTLPMLVELRE